MTKSVRATAFTSSLAVLLLAASPSIAADQAATPSESKPAEKTESVAQAISMINAATNRIVTLTDAQKLKLDDIGTALKDKYGPELSDAKADAFLADYINRVKKILTPEQRSVFEPRMEIARRATNETRNRIRCATHLKRIGSAMLLYSNEHRNAFPPDLGSLIAADYGLSPENFLCPDTHRALPFGFKLWAPAKRAEWVNANSDYVYRGGNLNNSEPPEKVIAYEKPDNHAGAVSTNDEGGGNILFGDGHIEFMRAADFARVIKQGSATTAPSSR